MGTDMIRILYQRYDAGMDNELEKGGRNWRWGVNLEINQDLNDGA